MTTALQQEELEGQDQRQVEWPKRLNNDFNSISEFTILADSGEGAFSKVHKAIHNSTGRIYAIKTVTSKQPISATQSANLNL